MNTDLLNRRNFLTATAAGTALILTGCSGEHEAGPAEVTAVEDLMREHGILRRALFIYSETAKKLLTASPKVITDSLNKTAMLFRSFGEDYHEKKLEEAYIFPAIKKAQGPAAPYPDILIAQHNRGRQITDFIISATQPEKTLDAEKFPHLLESFVRMYTPHAAIEDTVIFPAWKQTLTQDQFDEMGDKFEEIEQQQFGKDGFEAAVKQIAAIETALGLSDLSQFTAPEP